MTITPNTYTLANPASIVASRSNRKHFDADALQALSYNIKARGIDQPIIIRPLPGSRLAETFDVAPGQPRPAYEIVSGERRYRAAIMAGLVQVPVILRNYTDAEAIEAQLIENIQRESLSELDEAEGFELWLQQPGITVDVLASKISKSTRYVFSRLQLLKLQSETKHALRTRQIDVSRALLLAPVHDPKLQLKALEYAATVPTGGTQPSVRDLGIWLRQNVMLDLARAPFQITAANLIAGVGSCKTCPKRTGADPDMFSHVDGADICTDPPCYNTKATAHIAELQHQADKRGLRLVHGSEAKAACYEKSSTLNGYSPLSQVRHDLASGLQGQRLDYLLGHSAALPAPGAVLIENPYTKELIAAIPTAEAEAALLAKGLIKVMEAPEIKTDKAKGKKDVDADIAKLKSNTEIQIKHQYEDQLNLAIIKAVSDTDDDEAMYLLTPEFLKAAYLDEFQYTAAREVLGQLGIADKKIDQLTNADVFRFVALFLAQEGAIPQEALAKDVGVHLGRLREDAKEHVKAEVTAQIAALKAAQKTPPPKSPLAQPPATPAADAENQKSKPAKPKPKAKLSAKDAQLGIADAMQAIQAPPTDGAVPVLKAAHKFAIGQQVVVVSVDLVGSAWREKYIGKKGKVTDHPDTSYPTFEVTFSGRSGGLADFTAAELEAA